MTTYGKTTFYSIKWRFEGRSFYDKVDACRQWYAPLAILSMHHLHFYSSLHTSRFISIILVPMQEFIFVPMMIALNKRYTSHSRQFPSLSHLDANMSKNPFDWFMAREETFHSPLSQRTCGRIQYSTVGSTFSGAGRRRGICLIVLKRWHAVQLFKCQYFYGLCTHESWILSGHHLILKSSQRDKTASLLTVGAENMLRILHLLFGIQRLSVMLLSERAEHR
ncbi:hypothetical protein ACEQPO_16310 [Bacillus sp. SL00103]